MRHIVYSNKASYTSHMRRRLEYAVFAYIGRHNNILLFIWGVHVYTILCAIDMKITFGKTTTAREHITYT